MGLRSTVWPKDRSQQNWKRDLVRACNQDATTVVLFMAGCGVTKILALAVTCNLRACIYRIAGRILQLLGTDAASEAVAPTLRAQRTSHQQ